MSDKPKFHRETALAVVREILPHFRAERVIIAGSLRRRKPLVGDIEIVYIPKLSNSEDKSDLFRTRVVVLNHSDESIDSMLKTGLLARRTNVLGSTTWGDKNKLAIHVASGIPVDFFATTERAWWNYLVCRTGGSETNTTIATAAQKKGWKWHPYSWGFTDESGVPVEVKSERDVFDFVGLPYREPWERV
jgi:DNA polymerase/3'-5' exonuclease PolX